MSTVTVPETLGKSNKLGSLDPLPAGIVASSVTPFRGRGGVGFSASEAAHRLVDR
jgi:hypothetical protein